MTRRVTGIAVRVRDRALDGPTTPVLVLPVRAVGDSRPAGTDAGDRRRRAVGQARAVTGPTAAVLIAPRAVTGPTAVHPTADRQAGVLLMVVLLASGRAHVRVRTTVGAVMTLDRAARNGAMGGVVRRIATREGPRSGGAARAHALGPTDGMTIDRRGAVGGAGTALVLVPVAVARVQAPRVLVRLERAASVPAASGATGIGSGRTIDVTLVSRVNAEVAAVTTTAGIAGTTGAGLGGRAPSRLVLRTRRRSGSTRVDPIDHAAAARQSRRSGAPPRSG